MDTMKRLSTSISIVFILLTALNPALGKYAREDTALSQLKRDIVIYRASYGKLPHAWEQIFLVSDRQQLNRLFSDDKGFDLRDEYSFLNPPMFIEGLGNVLLMSHRTTKTSVFSRDEVRAIIAEKNSSIFYMRWPENAIRDALAARSPKTNAKDADKSNSAWSFGLEILAWVVLVVAFAILGFRHVFSRKRRNVG